MCETPKVWIAENVTESDMKQWLTSYVPHIDPNTWRTAVYVKQWNVIGKIQRAKAAGKF